VTGHTSATEPTWVASAGGVPTGTDGAKWVEHFNTVECGGSGIRSYGSAQFSITDNTIVHVFEGIRLYEDSGTYLSGNNIEHYYRGIYILESYNLVVGHVRAESHFEGKTQFGAPNVQLRPGTSQASVILAGTSRHVTVLGFLLGAKGGTLYSEPTVWGVEGTMHFIDNGNRNYVQAGFNISRGSTAPTANSYPLGAVRWNLNPEPGGYAGWICVEAGTPGTWLGFGSIAAS
jgi:parallel beta-helix repeat protein